MFNWFCRLVRCGLGGLKVKVEVKGFGLRLGNGEDMPKKHKSGQKPNMDQRKTLKNKI